MSGALLMAPPMTLLRASSTSGLIFGRVIDGTTGAPIAKVGVNIPMRLDWQLTDDQGQFAFFDVPAGTYFPLAVKEGYSRSYGYQPWSDARELVDVALFGRTAPPLIVQEGERKSITLTMWPKAVITGRVLDEAGEPVVGVRVTATPRLLAGGRAWLPPLYFDGVTDDRGQYRIPSLVAGDYTVAIPAVRINGQTVADFVTDYQLTRMNTGALLRGPEPPLDLTTPRIQTYATTYAPGVSGAATATVVRAVSGRETTNIDIVLSATAAYTVAGTLISAGGQVANLPVRLIEMVDDIGERDVALGMADAAGHFSFTGIPRGNYQIRVRWFPNQEIQGGSQIMAGSSTRWSMRADAWSPKASLWADSTVTVVDHDVLNATVPLRHGARIAGTVQWRDAAPTVDPSVVAIVLENADGRLAASFASREIALNTNGQFQSIGMRPGKYFIRMRAAELQAGGLVVASAMWRGRDLLVDSLDLGSEDINGVVITIAPSRVNVRGVVAGDHPEDDVVVLFPREEDRWTDFGWNPPHIRAVPTSDGGRFSMADVPDGEYYIAAVHASVMPVWPSPTVMRAILSGATRVIVQNGKADVPELHRIAWRPR